MNKSSLLNRGWFAVYLAVVLLLHSNAILKSEDPIRDNQTEGILYDQKMEQEKDGVKAPATPRIVFYGGQGFLTKSSLAKKDDGSSTKAAKKKDAFNWSDWWDDKPTDPGSEEEKSFAAGTQENAAQDTGASDQKQSMSSNPELSGATDPAPSDAGLDPLDVRQGDTFFDEPKNSNSLVGSTGTETDFVEASDNKKPTKTVQKDEDLSQTKGDDWW